MLPAETPVLQLPRGNFVGFFALQGDMLHWLSENMARRGGPNVPHILSNFTSIGLYLFELIRLPYGGNTLIDIHDIFRFCAPLWSTWIFKVGVIRCIKKGFISKNSIMHFPFKFLRTPSKKSVSRIQKSLGVQKWYIHPQSIHAKFGMAQWQGASTGELRGSGLPPKLFT